MDIFLNDFFVCFILEGKFELFGFTSENGLSGRQRPETHIYM